MADPEQQLFEREVRQVEEWWKVRLDPGPGLAATLRADPSNSI